jgi:CheY-like chemotaxis protein
MSRAADNGGVLGGVHVLLVEDNDDEREMLVLVLRHQGARVTAVASACEALAALDRELPEVVVSDICLLDLDGYELVHRLRARDASRGGRVPAVAVTGWTTREDELHALDSGFQIHLSKPVALDTLVATIAGLAAECRATADS